MPAKVVRITPGNVNAVTSSPIRPALTPNVSAMRGSAGAIDATPSTAIRVTPKIACSSGLR